MLTFVHARAYPAFTVLCGYGLVQLARRQELAGATPTLVRAVLVRRSLWLIVFGFLHALFLYFGDFLGAYGIIGFAAVMLLLYRRERVQRTVLWLWALSLLYVFTLGALAAFRAASSSDAHAGLLLPRVDSLAAPDYLTSMGDRLVEWPLHTVTVLPAILIVWLGMWAARHQLLENASTHRSLLRWVAGVGLGIAFAGGLPLGLVSAGILHVDSAAVNAMSRLHQVSGMFGGLGYVALFGLAAVRRFSPASPKHGIAALGRRSLSGYLFQSVAWMLVLSPYTLDLGRRFERPLATGCAIAVVVWGISVFGARAMDRRAYRGPAEILIRGLVYGKGYCKSGMPGVLST